MREVILSTAEDSGGMRLGEAAPLKVCFEDEGRLTIIREYSTSPIAIGLDADEAARLFRAMKFYYGGG